MTEPETGDENELCGYEDTTTGRPCQNPAGSCPWHGEDAPETGRKELDPADFQEEVADYLENGETVAVACALANISTSKYYEWHARAQEPDASEEFVEFSETTARETPGSEGVDGPPETDGSR